MSRIGRLPIQIPEKVNVTLDGDAVTVDGPGGKLHKTFNKVVDIEVNEGVVNVTPRNSSRLARAMHGTARSIISGMVEGVTSGFSKQLKINGVGFRASVQGRMLNLSLGFSHPVNYSIPEGITVTVTANTNLKVEGADKHLVGQVAADIKSFYPVEPYKGKGVRIIGQYVRRKEGKKAG